MPVLVTLQFPKGKEYKDIEKSMAQVTDVLSDTLAEPPENIRVTVKEVARNRYSVGGVLRSEVESGDSNEK